MTNPRLLSNDERRAAADGYEPGLLGAAMERILAAQDDKTRRATVEEAIEIVKGRCYVDDDSRRDEGRKDVIRILRAMLAPPEPEMVEVIRFDSTTGMGNLTRSIRIPLADWERYAKGGGK